MYDLPPETPQLLPSLLAAGVGLFLILTFSEWGRRRWRRRRD